ncbi:hypothetical protein ACIGGF_17135 [Rhodococcus sp. NPDC078407]|uniref:hypothetical protein n=1 Tax=Rhodococcus sp. NPDC078407 TaxID=3364509 RepID=UPI0037C52917
MTTWTTVDVDYHLFSLVAAHREPVSEPVEDYFFEIWPATMRRELTRVKTANDPRTSKPGSVRPASTSARSG